MRVGRTGVEAVEVGCRVQCQVAVAPDQSPQVISPGVVRELADLPQQQPVLRVGEHQLQDTPSSEVCVASLEVVFGRPVAPHYPFFQQLHFPWIVLSHALVFEFVSHGSELLSLGAV